MSRNTNQSRHYETLYRSGEVATLFLWLGALFLMLSRNVGLFDTPFQLWASALSILALIRIVVCRMNLWKKSFHQLNPLVAVSTVLMWGLLCMVAFFPARTDYSNEVTYLFLLLSSVSASVIFYPVQWMVVVKNAMVFSALAYLLFSASSIAEGMSLEMFWIKAGLIAVVVGFNLKLSQNFFEDQKQYRDQIKLLNNQRDEMSTKAEDLEEVSYFKEYLVEATEAASKAKSVFLANISHEIRTPLNAVIGFSQVLKEEETMPDRFQENLNRISLNAQHLLVLINDVLDMSKIEAGKLELEPEPVELHKLLDNIVEFLISRADDKGIDLIVEIDPSVPQRTELDPLKLRQVLINLLGNAIKFTDEGSVRLYAREGAEPGLVEFGVKDSGVGIAQEDQDRLFREFEQLTNSKGMEGTGLGLTISSRIISLMGGQLQVSSVLGEGSCFSFTVPLQRLSVDATRSKVVVDNISNRTGGTKTNTIDQFSFKNARVLIADDIQSNRLLLKTALKSLGLNFFEAVDGKEAFEVWREEMPDLILMDRRMPRIDGVESTKLIVEEAEKRGLPKPVIFAVTADVIGKTTTDQWPGIDGFIPKPFDIREIRQIVSSCLGQIESSEDELVLPS